MAPPADLIAATARGDEEAIAAIVAEHGMLVFNTCLRVLGNREEAEDAAQAAFILFLKKAKSLDSKTVLAAWLHRAAELVAREHLRAKRRRAAHEKEAAMRRETDADTEREWQALRPELDAAIAQLPERYRSAIILSYMEGKSTAEAGAALGVPQSTITTWLDRGRQKLREILNRRGVNLSAAVLVALLSSRLAESPVPATLLPGAVAAAKSLAAGTLEATLPLQVSLMLKGAMKMLFWIRIKYACILLGICLLAGVATPLAIRAASEEKKEPLAPAPAQQQPAPVDPAKPLDLGEIAYTGGAFTPDGKHFVYALIPKGASNESELKAVEGSTGTVQSLGMIPLIQKRDLKLEENWGFKWSMGVLGAENDLAIVYVAEFGVDLEAKKAIAWDTKKRAQIKDKVLPDLDTAHKEGSAGATNVKLVLKELDTEAGKKREEYVPASKLEGLLGKKQLSIEIAGVTKPISPIDLTEVYKPLYAEAVAKYPKQDGPPVSGGVLESDSIAALAQSGKWVLANAGIYVHYGIWGNGYGRVLLIDTQSSRVIAYPQISSYSASGVRSGPIQELFVASPDHTAVAAMSQGHLTLYRLPAE